MTDGAFLGGHAPSKPQLPTFSVLFALLPGQPILLTPPSTMVRLIWPDNEPKFPDSVGVGCLRPLCQKTGHGRILAGCMGWCFSRFAGYEAGACKQAEQVVVTLKVLIGAVPTCMILTGLCILMVSPTPKVPSQDTSRQLSLRRWAPCVLGWDWLASPQVSLRDLHC